MKHTKEIQDGRQRLKEIISILNKHELVRGLSPQKLRSIIEDLGPTFVKLGQIISMRTDIIPKEYCEELKLLRAEVKPMPYEEVEEILENSYGQDVSKVFSSFDKEPIGAASIAQVHTATLRSGEKIVVKIQREGIYDTMAHDMALLHHASKIIKRTPGLVEVVDFDMVLDEMWAVAKDEMNFLVEADNAEKFYQLNQDVAYVSCPIIYHEYTTAHVLAMEYIDGFSISDKDKLTEGGYDLNEIGSKLADNYMKQIMEDGFFHADPHPGNIRIREGEIVWIDLGMVGHLTPRDQNLIGEGVKAVANKDINGIIDVILALGKIKGKVDRIRLYSDIDELLMKYGDLELGNMDITVIVNDLMEVVTANNICMPSGISMLVRGLATIEGVIADLSPDINIMKIAGNRIVGNIFSNFDWKKELKHQGFVIYQSSKKALEIPALLSDTMKMAVKGQTKINLELHTDDETTRFLHNLVNKLIAGLLVVGLFISSSLLCTTSMQPKLLGIPALGVLGYLAALVLSVWIFVDLKKRRH